MVPALCVGVSFHRVVVFLAGKIVRYDNLALADDNSVIEESDSADQFCWNHVIVVCLADQRDVYLGKEWLGRAYNTHQIEVTLKSKLKEYEQAHLALHSRELSTAIRRHPQYRMVYIKASVNSPYGDVVSLIGIMKRLGARQIGLVADRRKQLTKGRLP